MGEHARPYYRCVLAWLLVSLAVASPSTAKARLVEPFPTQTTVVLHAVRVDEGPKIEGQLSEQVWKQAVPFDDFIQQVPDTGAPASERTEVRILYTDTDLYFGVSVLYRDLDMIRASELRYDQPRFHRGDDTISILLDTFHDHRNGYEFIFNALGTRADWAMTGEGRHWNRFWDPVWQVATEITAEGWTAEVRIPFTSLRYRDDGGSWGINVRRSILHRNEWAHATPISPGYRRPYDGIGHVSGAADLQGLDAIEGGRVVEVRPYLSADVSTQVDGPEKASLGFDPGVDLKYGFTPNLNLDLTYNTDFSQVEVDEQQINLTRFGLFFPEKRTFFQEGQGIFDFGVRRGDYRVMPFFSRRIGLENGVPVPISGGGKLTGKLGNYSVGVLALRSREQGVHAGNDFAVMRVKRDVLGQSSIGLLFTDRRSNFSDTANQVMGLDANLAFGARNRVDLFWVRSNDEGAGDMSSAYRAHVLLENDLFGFETDWMRVGDVFNPGIGFVQRRGIHRRFVKAQISPRPRKLGMRKVSLITSFDYIDNLNGQPETKIWANNLVIESEHDDFVTLGWQHANEVLTQPFSIAGMLPVRTGDYRFAHWSLGVTTSGSRDAFVNLNLRAGGFFDGQRTDARINAFLKVGRHLVLDTGLSHSAVRLTTGELDATLARVRGSYAFNPLLWTSMLVQWNSVSREFGVNARLRFTYRPGSDIYLVLNQRAISPESTWLLRERSLIVKWTYLLQL